ncbi:MAG: hypothetical protein E5V60_20870 [Mesorhizobium sp.]|uniref:hypothetical protein n=1 Tax=Mesorhizobium sp. M4A.F.Ca.ET.090.04.2.1 TaxID=2496663 RepID=UPI000FCA484F|nr:hypothetical protein [Mesorhizobium sp. M4A.F.Ca.ET.090.04.2.1]RVC45098.1 hypothetical protein EN781_11215 [Mesorhizobium sp. M4A.F.Ca.ET.090.04.2.1]TIW64055.1 MAG: hypothetical protein E5V60_20870 [Mesorhizobium sp.]
MAQLIDLDERLYENARIVYRFLVGWYHEGHGDALLSMRHVSKVMKQRAPEGANVLSHSVVQRAVIALMETGWVVRTHKGRGKGKGASRFVPVLNVLDLAAQGKFPEPSHSSGAVELSHSGGTEVSRAIGTVEAEPSHSSGTKTLLQDTVTKTRVPVVIDSSSPVAGGPLAAAPGDGFERLFSAYGKPDDNRGKARQAFNEIKPNVAELGRMILVAESWKRTASGKRMSLERWLKEKRWLMSREVINDTRKTYRWPSCVVTWVKPKYDAEGLIDIFYFKYRDRDGLLQTRVLDYHEFDEFREQVKADRPGVGDPSLDMHEFIGARFQADDDGMFSQYLKESA